MLREPAAFRATHVDGLGTSVREHRTVRATRPATARRPPRQTLRLPWTRLTVHLAAPG